MDGAKHPHELPPEDQPDYEMEALVERLGLMHISDALEQTGQLDLIIEQTLEEMNNEIVRGIRSSPQLSGKALADFLEDTGRRYVAILEDRASALGLRLPKRKKKKRR